MCKQPFVGINVSMNVCIEKHIVCRTDMCTYILMLVGMHFNDLTFHGHLFQKLLTCFKPSLDIFYL